MPAKSVIDIDLNDERFRRFQELFERYQTTLAKTPSHWAGAGKEMEKYRTGFDRVAAAMAAQHHLGREDLKDTEKLGTHLEIVERMWKRIGHETKGTAHNIKQMTMSLLRWGTILSGATGLLGIGGLFGLDRLASSVGNERKRSQGLGVTIGQAQAFKIDMGRFVNSPDNFLSQISALETSPGSYSQFARLGVAKTGDVFTDALAALTGLRRKAQETPIDQLDLLRRQLGLPWVTDDELRRLHTSDNGEYFKYLGRARSDALALSTSPRGNLAWQNLETQFGFAAYRVFDAFQTRLSQLAPDIKKVSSAFTTLAVDVINSPFTRKVIDDIGSGLQGLDTYLQSKQFKTTLKDWETSLMLWEGDARALGKRIHADLPNIEGGLDHLAKIFGKFATNPGGEAAHLAKRAAEVTGNAISHRYKKEHAAYAEDLGESEIAFGTRHPWLAGPLVRWIGRKNEKIAAAERARLAAADFMKRWPAALAKGTSGARAAFLAHPTAKTYLALLAAANKAEKFPAGMLERQWMAESGGRFANVPISSKGAIGPFQFRPDTAKQIGIDPSNPVQSALAAAMFDRELVERLGSLEAGLAGYHAGPGRVSALISAHPSDWESYLGPKTRAYIESIFGPLERAHTRDIAEERRLAALSGPRSGGVRLYTPPPPVHLVVHQAPGSDMTIAAHQVASQ